jgi:hypothetical protein
VGRRVLPVLLALAAWGADAHGSHGLAFYLLLAAVPAAASAGLGAFGDSLDGRGERAAVQAALWGLATGLLVLSCAARSSHGTTASLPPLGSSALIACFGVLTLKLFVSGAGLLRRSAPQAVKP